MPTTTYDSDSSSDGEEYTTTNVVLGYATSDPSGDDISHIGGHPKWIESGTTPSTSLAKCKACNGYMSLLLQLNADLQQYFPDDHRRLHVWCCRKKVCSRKVGSIRAFREVKKTKSASKTQQKTPATTQQSQEPVKRTDLGSQLFGSGAGTPSSSNNNPFGSSSSGAAAANPFSSINPQTTLAAKPPQRPVEESEPPTTTFAEKLKITDGDTPEDKQAQIDQWPEESAFPAAFTSFYLDAYPEELEPLEKETVSGPSKSQYDMDDAGGSSTDKDTFESALDKTFQKFSDRVAQNPEQVLRYEFKGEPLLYSGSDGVAARFLTTHGKSGPARGIPRCETCGAQRVSEVQLMPGLIFELEKDEALDLEDGMEWGTIIVGTCVNNCGEAGKVSFREEWAGVQWEEGVARK